VASTARDHPELRGLYLPEAQQEVDRNAWVVFCLMPWLVT